MYKTVDMSKNILYYVNMYKSIVFYSKSEKFKFNEKLIDYSPTTNLDQILQLRKRDENGKNIAHCCDETRKKHKGSQKESIFLMK